MKATRVDFRSSADKILRSLVFQAPGVTGGDPIAARAAVRGAGDFTALQISAADLAAAADLPVAALAPAPAVQEEAFAGVKRVEDIAVFPEDTVLDLRHKIYAASGVPPYRLWIPGAFEVELAGQRLDTRVPVKPEKVGGTTVDRYLYDNRENLQVTALDTFRFASAVIAGGRVSVYDINDWVAPFRRELADAARDRYAEELLYFGFMLPRWPTFSQQMFRTFFVESEDAMLAEAPDALPPREGMAAQFREEFRLMRKVHAARGAVAEFRDGIHGAVARVAGAEQAVFLREIFDQFAVDAAVPVVIMHMRTREKDQEVTKAYRPSRCVPVIRSSIFARSGITFVIVIRDTSCTALGRPFSETNDHFILNIQNNGVYTVESKWYPEDYMSFDRLLKMMQANVNPVLRRVYATAAQAFSLGVPPLITAASVTYTSLSVSLYWKQKLDDEGFRRFRALWKALDASGVTGVRVTKTKQLPSVHTLKFHKGVLGDICKFRNVQGGRDVANLYSWTFNPQIRRLWLSVYPGKSVAVRLRMTHVEIEIKDVNQTEFAIIRRVAAQPVAAMAGQLSAARSTARRNRLESLQESDPRLYNLSGFGSRRLYSVVCQKPHQPILFTELEANNLAAKKRAALTKYHNFTTDEPAYYGCPNPAFPHLSFIHGVHPQGWCIPCCKKSPPVAGTKRAAVDAACVKNLTFSDDESADTRHVMAFGKHVLPGRIGKPPPISLTVLPDVKDLFLFGVEQHTPGLCNCGAAFALALALGLSVEELVADFTERLDETTFRYLVNGAARDTFPLEKFKAVVRGLFVTQAPEIGAESARFKQWNQLFIDAAYYLHEITVVAIVQEGDSFYLKLQPLPRRDKILVVFLNDCKFFPLFRLGSFHRDLSPGQRLFAPSDVVVPETPRAYPADARVTLRFFDARGRNYAVLVERRKALVYVPSGDVPGNAPKTYEPFRRGDYRLDLAPALRLLDISAPDKWLVFGGKCIGFLYNQGRYYVSPPIEPPAGDAQTLRHDPDAVNAALARPGEADPAHQKLLLETVHRNFSYRLFVLEFLSHTGRERNAETRKKIARGDRVELSRNDQRALARGALSANYQYEFDRLTINELQGLKRPAVLRKVRAIMRTLTVAGEPKAEMLPNVLTPCARNKDAPQCKGGKLVVRKEVFDAYCGLLADDLLNPIKQRYFHPSFMVNTVLDPLRFEAGPDVEIRVRETRA